MIEVYQELAQLQFARLTPEAKQYARIDALLSRDDLNGLRRPLMSRQRQLFNSLGLVDIGAVMHWRDLKKQTYD